MYPVKTQMKNTWIIVPGLNEANTIRQVLKNIKKMSQNIIFVDDGSNDNSFALAKKEIDHVLRHEVNLGKGSALKTGSEYAFKNLGAEAVIFMDADGQHDPEDLQLFFKALKKHQVVFGVRSFNEKMPLVRIFLNRVASLFVYLMFGSYVPDIPSGYKAMTKSAYQKLHWNSRDYAVEMEIAAKVAAKHIDYVTVPVKTIYNKLDRGMTLIDTVRVAGQMIGWRLNL